MLLDANLLLYAVHSGSQHHEAAAAWLTERLNGSRRVGLPWSSLAAFLRISTHPRAFDRPLPRSVAWERIRDWLAAPVRGSPSPDPSTHVYWVSSWSGTRYVATWFPTHCSRRWLSSTA